MGSPPRVREKPCTVIRNSSVSGITPACAGKTLALTFHRAGTQDHPRVCGKNSFKPYPAIQRLGSPPRVREKHAHSDFDCAVVGITPASAGKTEIVVFNRIDDMGSPPRVREKLIYRTDLHNTPRITPASAGKTTSSTKLRVTAQDHPRECGKNGDPVGNLYRISGSPPRVREKHKFQTLDYRS